MLKRMGKLIFKFFVDIFVLSKPMIHKFENKKEKYSIVYSHLQSDKVFVFCLLDIVIACSIILFKTSLSMWAGRPISELQIRGIFTEF